MKSISKLLVEFYQISYLFFGILSQTIQKYCFRGYQTWILNSCIHYLLLCVFLWLSFWFHFVLSYFFLRGEYFTSSGVDEKRQEIRIRIFRFLSVRLLKGVRIKFVIQDSRIDSIEIELILVLLILLEDLFLPINPILKDARREVVVQLGSPYLTKEFLERIPVGYFLIFIRCDFVELCLEI